MKINTIFFDFDGVLAESVEVKTEAFRQMYLMYGRSFSEKVVDYHKKNGGISRFEKFKTFNGDWLNQKINEKVIHKLAIEFSRLVVKGVIDSKEVEGASSFLNYAKNYKKFIITGTPTEEIKIILKKRNMSDLFLEALGSPTNKSFWVRHVLDKYNIDKNECIFVGDAYADYEAARDNGVTFVLRETDDSLNLFKDLELYRIKNLNELKSIIDIINIKNENISH